jgi:hypothetical protein
MSAMLLLVGIVAASVGTAGQPTAPISGQVRLTFTHLPRGVSSAAVYAWREDGAATEPAVSMTVAGDSVTIPRLPGDAVVVIFAGPRRTYLLDGPFTWPVRAEVRPVDQQWRRTIDGSSAQTTTRPALEWIGSERGDAWPQCRWSDDRSWRCWGVPARAAGVVAAADVDGILWTSASAADGAVAPLRYARWGRLLLVRTERGDSPAVRAAIIRPIPPPPERFRSTRLTTGPVAGAHVTVVGPGAVWIAGGTLPRDAWIDVRAPGCAPVYLPAETVADGARQVPLEILLEDARPLGGVVTTATGVAVGGALVTLSRLIDPVDEDASVPDRPAGANGTAARSRPRARRVFVAEATSDADGRFAFGDLADVDYEVLVWQPQLGRASVLAHGGASVRIRLSPAGAARGRVTVGGRPAAGVPVVSVPDMHAIGELDDPLEARGGDGQTGEDGRFVVALPPRGGGELRIGGGAHGVRRVPLPPGRADSLDLGDIELAPVIVMTFTVDQDPGCDLVLVGPEGHAGLQIVTARRIQAATFEATLPEEGQWRPLLSCGDRERAVAPPVVVVKAGNPHAPVALRVQ